jgi:PAS domain S-box-containing protein
MSVPAKNVVALIAKSLDGRIIQWDEGAEKIFGYSAAEAVGKHISIIIPFDFQDEEYELLDRLKGEDYLEVRKTVRRTKSGYFIMVRLSATPLRNEDGKIIGALKRIEFVQSLSSPRLPPS